MLIPVPAAAGYYADMMGGGLPSRLVDIATLYLGAAALYGVVATGAGRLLVGGVAPGALLAGSPLFAILAGPMLLLQVASEPFLVTAATFCGFYCGAMVGGLFAREAAA